MARTALIISIAAYYHHRIARALREANAHVLLAAVHIERFREIRGEAR